MERLIANMPLEVEFYEEGLQDPEHLYLLLHGYSESADTIRKRLLPLLEKKGKVIIPNAPFPLPKSFPLSERPSGKDLLSGYAWYFYDAQTDKFLIPYEGPAQYLGDFINRYNKNDLPLTIIGYSQGGYLTPFLAQYAKNVRQVIGINCSFRDSLLTDIPNYEVHGINGDCDIIVDPLLAKERFQRLKERGLKGEFHLVKDATHRLGEEIKEKIKEILL